MRLMSFNHREYGRELLWSGREEFLVHMMGDDCAVRAAIKAACIKAQWDYESYFLAALFNSHELIVETPGRDW
jgi:hypothetical protein